MTWDDNDLEEDDDSDCETSDDDCTTACPHCGRFDVRASGGDELTLDWVEYRAPVGGWHVPGHTG